MDYKNVNIINWQPQLENSCSRYRNVLDCVQSWVWDTVIFLWKLVSEFVVTVLTISGELWVTTSPASKSSPSSIDIPSLSSSDSNSLLVHFVLYCLSYFVFDNYSSSCVMIRYKTASKSVSRIQDAIVSASLGSRSSYITPVSLRTNSSNAIEFWPALLKISL